VKFFEIFEGKITREKKSLNDARVVGTDVLKSILGGGLVLPKYGQSKFVGACRDELPWVSSHQSKSSSSKPKVAIVSARCRDELI
jgi:hypothetical protein